MNHDRGDDKGSLTVLEDAGRIYLDVLEVTQDLVAVVDRSYRYVAVNPAHARAHGRAPEEMVGRSVAEVMGADAFEKQLRENYDRALAGELLRFFGWFEVGLLGRRYCSVGFKPRLDEHGAVVGVVIFVRDLTDLELATDSLRRSQGRLEVALAAARMGIWEWSISTNTLDWSDQVLAMFGVSRESFGGTYEAFKAFLHPDDVGSVDAAVQHALIDPAAGSRYVVEYRILRTDGEQRWQLAKGQVFRDDSGAPIHMVGVVTDITEHKNLEAQLRQSQKLEAIGRLARGIAHDFNNILTGLIGEASLALLGEQLSDNLRGSLAAIIDGSQRAAALTQRLLTFARQSPVGLRPLCLNDIVDNMKTLLRWTLGDQVELALELAPGLDFVEADATQLEQVLLNLAVNARDAMGSGGRLTISTSNVNALPSRDGSEPRPGVRLRVSDTGHGIPAEVAEHIFEPFFTTRAGPGNSGLGLATCYGIVEQLGGVLLFESMVHAGSTFDVLLPRCDAPDRADDAILPAPTPTRSGLVVLVEDDDWVRHVLRGQLVAAGYTVTDFDSAEAAARSLRAETPPDLLVTDLMMPGMNGDELVRTVHEVHPDLPALIVSGHAHPGDDLACGLGVSLLTKPFTAQQFAEAVAAALSARQSS